MARELEPWFVSAFRADYVEVYRHRDLESARREARHLVASGVGGRVLDLACGFGRHVLALREQRVQAFGVDLSADLLAHARSLPDANELMGRLIRGDARAVPFAAGSLDSVVVLFSSFGYFGEAGDRTVLAEMARVLRPGGLAVLDLMNPARVRAELVSESRRERGDLVLEERRELLEGGRRVEKHVRLRARSGRGRAWRESVRLYEPEEIVRLLDEAHLALVRVEGDFDGSPFSPGSARQILYARRR